MDLNEEYHDPDYPEAPVCIKEEPPSLSEEEKVEKIKEIIRREFLNELEIRENEVMLIDQRMTTSRRLLHRLRYALVSSYYQDQKLQLTNGQVQDEIALQTEPRARAEVSTVLRDGQRRLHPSVRKLLGKQTVDLDEIFKIRGPRNKTRKDYSAMLQKRNYTISADTTKTLRPDRKPDELEILEDPSTSRPKKIPRHLEPKPTNVLTLDEVTRNKTKYRYRIVIGNTSKFAPPASRLDRSTHKWLLYVRGAPPRADLSAVLTAVSVRLHHSYAPHHTVHIDKPPYHVSRRGWGEFPAKVELHFALPERNRPATVEHTIKLDRNYTGLQMLGAETVVDVWLYSTPEMLPYQFKEDEQPEPITQAEPVIEQKEPELITETIDNAVTHTDNWMEFFSKETTEVDVDEMIIKPIKNEKPEPDLEPAMDNNVIVKIPEPEIFSEVNIKTEKEWDPDYKVDTDIPNEILSQPTSPKKRIVKYIDPTTGKIYYLEMDRNLDLSKVQEIVINNTKTAKISPIKSNGLKNFRKKKGGVSLLKPEVKNMLKNTENNVKLKSNLAHIENDHCYLATPRRNDFSTVEIKKEKSLYDCLCLAMNRVNTVRAGVNYLIKNIPLISDQARDTDFVKYFPFVVESEEKYWKLDFAKRRNIEWSRAKLINRILTEHLKTAETIWRTKQILLYSRLHGYYPIRSETINIQTDTHDWSSWNDLENHRKMESSIKELYPNPADISTLSIFDSSQFNRLSSESEVISLSDDEEVDVMSCVERRRVKTEVCDNTGLTVMPVENDDDRLRFLFIERKCADIGIELRNEDVGHGYSYSAVHAVLLSALRGFAAELLRGALARRLADRGAGPVWAGSSSSRVVVSARHVFASSRGARLRPLSAADLGVRKHAQRKL